MWILSYPTAWLPMGETKCGSSEMQNRVLEIISLIIQVIEDNLSFSWLWVLKVYSNYIYR